jgi:hypothetical protein
MVVIYHRNTPLPKVRKGLDGYTAIGSGRVGVMREHQAVATETRSPFPHVIAVGVSQPSLPCLVLAWIARLRFWGKKIKRDCGLHWATTRAAAWEALVAAPPLHWTECRIG